MTRDDIKARFPEATKEAIDQLLDINSADIGKAVSKAHGTQDQLETQVKNLNEQLAALKEQVTTANNSLAEKETALRTLADEKDNAINDLTAQLKTAQEKGADHDALTEQVARLKQDVADRDATIASNSKAYRIKNELRNQHARNADVVWNMLDINKIKEKDGELVGFAEQVEALRKSDAYLFDTNTGEQRGGFPGAQELGGVQNGNAAINDAIRTMAGRG